MHLLRRRRRPLPLSGLRTATSRNISVPLSERGNHPLYLRPLVEARQRKELLALRPGPSPSNIPYPPGAFPILSRLVRFHAEVPEEIAVKLGKTVPNPPAKMEMSPVSLRTALPCTYPRGEARRI